MSDSASQLLSESSKKEPGRMDNDIVMSDTVEQNVSTVEPKATTETQATQDTTGHDTEMPDTPKQSTKPASSASMGESMAGVKSSAASDANPVAANVHAKAQQTGVQGMVKEEKGNVDPRSVKMSAEARLGSSGEMSSGMPGAKLATEKQSPAPTVAVVPVSHAKPLIDPPSKTNQLVPGQISTTQISPERPALPASQTPVNPYSSLDSQHKPANLLKPTSASITKTSQTTSVVMTPRSAQPNPKTQPVNSVQNGATAPVQNTIGPYAQTQPRPATVSMPIAGQATRPLTNNSSLAQYNNAQQARTNIPNGQSSIAATLPQAYAAQFARTQPIQSIARPLPTYVKPDGQAAAPNQIPPTILKADAAAKDMMDDAENERTRLENRERKKRWREQNEDRNKDNDLRCRVNKRAHKLFGKERSEEKLHWIEEEFNKRKSKRQEKEGKAPDGSLLVEGTDISSLNHLEMNNAIMSTLSEFATNPAAPPLKDNADLNLLLHKVRTNPQSIREMFTGQPNPASIAKLKAQAEGNSLTAANIQKMETDQRPRQASTGADDEDEEDDDEKYSQAGSLTQSVVDMTAAPVQAASATHNGVETGVQGTQQNAALSMASAVKTEAPITTSTNAGVTQHQTYGIGSGFDAQVALSLSSELFRLISMQPADRKSHVEQQQKQQQHQGPQQQTSSQQPSHQSSSIQQSAVLLPPNIGATPAAQQQQQSTTATSSSQAVPQAAAQTAAKSASHGTTQTSKEAAPPIALQAAPQALTQIPTQTATQVPVRPTTQATMAQQQQPMAVRPAAAAPRVQIPEDTVMKDMATVKQEIEA